MRSHTTVVPAVAIGLFWPATWARMVAAVKMPAMRMKAMAPKEAVSDS